MKYKLMHRNTIIAYADENGITEIVDKSLCPACFVQGMPLEFWLDNRTVDIHRSHSRKLFKALRLSTSDNMDQIINTGHGISITDNWWIQRDDENLDHYSLKKYNEDIADLALYGSASSDSNDTSGYRELGTVGSYEKAWRYKDGSWFMYKHGNTQELVSEYFSYLFLQYLNADTAEYRIEQIVSEETGISSTFIITKDFTDNAEIDFEPFCNYFSDHEETEYIIPRLDKKLTVPYVMLTFYDTLLYNGDRHNQNIGVIRDARTGEITGLAPMFDFNLSLIATGIPRIDMNDGNVFTRCFLENDVCRKVLRENIPDEESVVSAVEYAVNGIKSNKAFPENINLDSVRKYILGTYRYLKERI